MSRMRTPLPDFQISITCQSPMGGYRVILNEKGDSLEFRSARRHLAKQLSLRYGRLLGFVRSGEGLRWIDEFIAAPSEGIIGAFPVFETTEGPKICDATITRWDIAVGERHES